MAPVTFDRVTKVYGEIPAVRELSLHVSDGELLALAGPSGSGKTTVLRLVAGLAEPTSGEIWIGERRVTPIPPKERDVAMVLQSYALYPQMTARDNVAFGLRLRGTPRAEAERRAEEVAEGLGLSALLERRPRELSAGERQRVAIARAIARRPAVLLLDEPLSALDADLRERARDAIVAAQREGGTTTIWATSDAAAPFADRVVTLRAGSVGAVTPARDAAEPAEEAVR